MFHGNPLRLGLCCIFCKADIQFRSRQAGHIMKLARAEQLDRLSTTVLHNASALMRALEYCADHDIGCFRINSGFFPLKSHPELRYDIEELPEQPLIAELLAACRDFARSRNIRLTFHPDQFTLLSSPEKRVTEQSLAELNYHGELADLLAADTVILHGGGAYCDKKGALARLEANISTLPENVRTRLALENDDRIYTPAELLPVCERTGTPLVYDVHHHRCLPDHLPVETATERALATWNREPVFHLSSPRDGWQAENPRPHHDYIDPEDFPSCWFGLEITVEVEAKAKELAVDRLQRLLPEKEPAPAGRKRKRVTVRNPENTLDVLSKQRK